MQSQLVCRYVVLDNFTLSLLSDTVHRLKSILTSSSTFKGRLVVPKFPTVLKAALFPSNGGP